MKHEPQGELAKIEFHLNGDTVHGHCEPRQLLSDFLRDELGQTGTHVGCEHGVCGSCTVLLDGMAVRSCLLLAVQVRDRKIDTVEGLNQSIESEDEAPGSALNELQHAFRKHHALQCGFCTPGILMSMTQLLAEESPDEARVRDVLSGHLCRCTGYTPIVDAVLEVAANQAKTNHDLVST